MKVRTNMLRGVGLNWAVAQAARIEVECRNGNLYERHTLPIGGRKVFAPAQNWNQGGPILERERISVISTAHAGTDGAYEAFKCEREGNPHHLPGRTYLEAGMRRFVQDAFGDFVEVPDDLAPASQ